ncbi:NAD(P)-dependent oxidoreductase [Streptomyces sp. MAR4 CNX-425]|uniref:NAD(P)-dependent oxidoreductase n=1 Tax=Streptomyces sp. MAR4 CNX-425 TaxID=3406343 RepID=UPI003B50AE30
MTMSKQHVTVIGLGPMGRAMAAALLAAGHPVTVWNRTPGRADALASRGATPADTVEDALRAGGLTVLSLTDYAAMYAVLTPAAAALPGRVLVNLSSDTPQESRAAAAWAAEHGAAFLAGGVGSPPSGIGSRETMTYYSGDEAVFAAHRETLEVLNRTDYRGADPGLAQVYYQIGMAMFWPAMLGYVHAMALARAHGLSAGGFLPYAKDTLGSLPAFADFYAPRIDARDHAGDVDRLAMAEASLDHVRHTAADARVDAALPAAFLEAVRRGMTAGHAGDSLTSLGEVFAERAA